MPKNTAPGLDSAINLNDDDGDDLVINLNDTQEATFEPLPAGIYEAVIDEAEKVTAASSGNPMIKVRFNIEEEPYTDRKLFQNWMLTDQGKPFLKRYLNSLGYRTDKQFSVADLVSDLPGMSCRVKVRQKMYEGQMVNNVTDILPSKGFGAAGGSDSDLPV